MTAIWHITVLVQTDLSKEQAQYNIASRILDPKKSLKM